MSGPRNQTYLKKAIAVSIIAAVGYGLTGCTAVEARYDGDYDPNFYDTIASYVGEEVSLSAEVLDVLSSTSFTVISGDDPTADPLLVLNGDDSENVRPGMPIQVTGVVMEAFDLRTVEADLDVDLDDALYEDWVGEFYLHVTAVDARAASTI